METKKAILVVSFGTSHLDTMKKTIEAIEQKIQDTFPEYRVYRAFTSQMILNKLRKTEHLSFYNVSQAMEQMAADKMETVAIQPTHIINGMEYDKMVEAVSAYEDRFAKITIGKPLLSSAVDYKMSIHAVMEQVELDDHEALVLMGHGTEHHANSAYPTLEYTFHSMGYHQVLVGTVEGFPDLNHVTAKLNIGEFTKVTLMPFMVVAGDHAKYDMAGEEDSWKSALEEKGYQVKTIVKGLGEMEGIRNIFIGHLEEALNG